MKRIVRLLAVLAVCVMMVRPQAVAAAATGSVSASVSASSVTIGKTVTLTVRYKCSAGIGGATSYITYNSSYLKLSSYSAGNNFNPANGKLLTEPTSDTSVSYTFRFTAIRTGSAAIKVQTNEFIDYNDGNDVGGYSGTISKTVTITEKPVTPTTTTQSSDSSLASLTVQGYDIGFSSDVRAYKLYVAHGVGSLDITAKPSSSKATVAPIKSDLTEGWNKVSVTCTAENKTTTEYVIDVYVEQTPTIWYQCQGVKLGVVKNLDGVTVDDTFTLTPLTIGAETVTTYVRGSYQLLYVCDESFNKSFYLYDRQADALIEPYQPITISGVSYGITAVDYQALAAQLSPETFQRQKVTIGDQQLDGWGYADAAMSDFKVVYLRDAQGVPTLYRYDMAQATLQRYAEPAKAPYNNLEAVLLAAAIAGLATTVLAIAVMSRRRAKG